MNEEGELAGETLAVVIEAGELVKELEPTVLIKDEATGPGERMVEVGKGWMETPSDWQASTAVYISVILSNVELNSDYRMNILPGSATKITGLQLRRGTMGPMNFARTKAFSINPGGSL